MRAAGTGGDGRAEALAPALRAVVHEADPALAVAGVETLAATFGRSVADLRFVAVLVGSLRRFGAAPGADRRPRRAGLRRRPAPAGDGHPHGAGCDARARSSAWCSADGLRFTLAGLVTGILLALLAGRGLAGLLFEVEPNDPATLAAVAGAVLATALLAALVPALAATRTDPVATLQEE